MKKWRVGDVFSVGDPPRVKGYVVMRVWPEAIWICWDAWAYGSTREDLWVIQTPEEMEKYDKLK